MAVIAAHFLAQKEKLRNTSPLPERNCRLIIQPESLHFTKPGNEVQGKLILDNSNNEPINIAGILVRLEINAVVQFQTKFDGQNLRHMKNDNVLADKDWATCYVLGGDSLQNTTVLPSGRFEYTFSLKPGRDMNKLPATIRSPSCTTLYQVVAYLQRSFPEKPDKTFFNKLISTPPMRNLGYYNLSLEPLAGNPISFEKCVQKSFFSKKNAFKATLNVNQSAFVAGEEIPFTISLNNISGVNVTKVSLSLVRKLILKTESECKTIPTVLVTKIGRNINRDTDTVWRDTLLIPDGLGPTFPSHTIEMQYLLRLEISCTDRVPVKGECPIIIGTTWGDAETDKSVRPGARLRLNSIESTVSAPPAYSALSSRQPSIETLPPDYDENMFEAGVSGLSLE